MKFMDLQRIYGAAGHELRTLLLSIDLSTFDGAKAEEIKHKAKRIVTYLNGVSGRWTRQTTKVAYEKAAEKAKAQLWKLGRRIPRGIMPARSGPGVVEATADTALLKATGSIMRTVEQFVSAALMGTVVAKGIIGAVQEFDYEDVEAEIADLAARAVKQELSSGTLKKQIMDRLRQLVGDENFIQIGERMYNLGAYARMVARTTIREAQTQATLDLCARYENDLVEVSYHGTDCDICLEYEGNTYSLSGNDPNFPILDEQPPFHPNCKHDILPTSEAEIRVREREG
ncbi:MAG: phage minor capsid protein [Candidatus Aminicenantes bacterium]|nr:phage minor capsid protein [Candidatus Aminicenantes bacterium]